MMTEEQMLARLLASPPPKPKPATTKPATVLKVATDRKLSVEGQRERVVREVKELAVAERREAEAPLDPMVQAAEYHREKRERDRQAGLYYRELYKQTATAEYWATQRDGDDARHGVYDPIARFEEQVRRGE
jgi:hypothetical protein